MLLGNPNSVIMCNIVIASWTTDRDRIVIAHDARILTEKEHKEYKD